MDDKDFVLTKERVIAYTKKYWWILVLFAVAGIILFGIGLASRKSQDNEDVPTYNQKVMIVSDSSVVASAKGTVIEDCRQFLMIEDIRNEIASQSEETEIKDWTAIQLTGTDNSRLLNVTIVGSDKEASDNIIEAVVSVLNKTLEDYDSAVELQPIGELNISSSDNSARKIVLKDILVLFGMIFLGILALYILIVLDKRIASSYELKSYFREAKGVLMEENDMAFFHNWLLSIKEQGSAVFIVSKGIEQLSEYIMNEQLDESSICTLSQYVEDNMAFDAKHKKKYLLIKSMQVKTTELNKLIQINLLHETNVDGWVFIK